MTPTPTPPSKEQVLADREAKRLAKLAVKHKLVDAGRNLHDDKDKAVTTATQTQATATSAGEQNAQKLTTAAASVAAAATDCTAQVEAETKSRDAVLAEREAKKLAKLAAKNKNAKPSANVAVASQASVAEEQTKPADPVPQITQPAADKPVESAHIAGDDNNNINKDKPVLSKAERRAKQEAQRAAKAAAQTAGKPSTTAANGPTKVVASAGAHDAAAAVGNNVPARKSPSALANSGAVGVTKQTALHRVKLFNHLYTDRSPEVAFRMLAGQDVHPEVVKLGLQYANRIVVGSNARCIAFLNTMKMVIREYETPPQKEFTRGLEASLQPCIAYLHQCRPLSVSVTNALKHIKWQINQLSAAQSEAEQREQLLDSVDTYVRDQVEKAAQAISISVQQKISNGDVILTFGCSSLISHILYEAQTRKVDFRVVVVDARPDHEGQEMLRRLVARGIRCTCVLVNAVGFIMPVVTKVLLGAHALMANGYVMSRAGTAQVALMAKAHNVPVLVCCETHKFSERVQTDAFVYNEIGRPSDLVLRPKVPSAGGSSRTAGAAAGASALANWEQMAQLTPLNLCYDITPPELVTAVVTELAILPCTSVPVILRIQPS